MPTTTRTFRVFVSSTFEDLRDERNILQATVFPKLETFCLEKGARFQAIDLRWGVREEAGLDQKTMDICLAEIARCQKTGIKPNFIVLLGNRYGWRPLPTRIQQDEFESVLAHVANTAERDFVASWYDLDRNAVPPEYLLKPRTGIYTDWGEWEPVEQRLHRALGEGARAAGLSPQSLIKYEASATHQEILKGLGETPEDRAHVFAFFRESGGDEDPDLTNLKNHLKAVLPAENVFPWSAGDHPRLSDDAERSLKTIIGATAAQFETQSEKVSHDRFAEDRAKHFKGRETVLDAIEQYLLGEDRRPLVVFGPSGSGKSAIMAVASEGKNAIRRFIGATPESSSGITMLRSLCRELGERFGQTGDLPATFNELSTMFAERLKLATFEQPIILFIDALDQLSAQDPAAAMRWLPAELPPYCHVALSATQIPEALRRAAMVALEPLPVDDASRALDAWLTEASRTLQPEQLEKLRSSFLQSGLPLYLKLAFEEARQWRSFDPPSLCVLGEGLPGIIDRLFARLSDPANHGRVLACQVFGYLTAARYGLTEDEILAVLTKDDVVWKDVVGEGARWRHNPPLRQLPVIVWSRLHLDLEPYLTERTVPGGTTVSFYHRQLAERVETTSFHHSALAAHFAEQEHWLGVNIPNRRKLTELVRQQVGAGLPGDAAGVLTDLDFVSAKCGAELVFDLEEDYREAIAARPDAQEALLVDQRRQAELERWTRTLIGCAKQERLPKPEEILKSVEPWSDERIAAESKRITGYPTRLDLLGDLKSFASFVEEELYPLLELGRTSMFVLQHAFNYAADGPVHRSATRQLAALRAPTALRIWRQSTAKAPIPALLRTLEGHTSSVTSVAVTPDGRLILSCSMDGTIKLWDADSGECLSTLKGHRGTVLDLSVTPDKRWALSSSNDGTARIWDLTVRTCLRVLEGHTSSVKCVDITPDGRTGVSGGSDGLIKVWNATTGQCLWTLVEHTLGVNTVRVTIDGLRAVSASDDGTIRLWDLATGRCVFVIEAGHDQINGNAYKYRVEGAAITSDGLRAFSGDVGNLKIWDLTTGVWLKTIRHTSSKSAMDVSPDGRIAVFGNDEFLHVWDLVVNQQKRIFSGHSRPVLCVRLTPDARRCVSGAADNTVRVWNVESGSSAASLRETWGYRAITGVFLAPGGNRAISANGHSGMVQVWDVASGGPMRTLDGRGDVSIMPDGRRVFAPASDGNFCLWDLESGQCLQTFKGDGSYIRCLCVTPDGRRAVSATGAATLSVWDLQTGRCTQKLAGHLEHRILDTITNVKITVDGQIAVSGGADQTLRVWDIDTGQCLRTLKGHEDVVRILGISPDGRIVASKSAGLDFTVRIWEIETGRCIHILRGHRTVTDVAFSRDWRRAVSGGLDDSLRVWDVHSGECLHALKTNWVTSVSVSPDGQSAVTGSNNRTMRVWDLETGECRITERLNCEPAVVDTDGNRIMLGATTGEVLFFEIHPGL